MGLEAQCSARVGRKTGSGKALLETETLTFRGDLRVSIQLDAIREVTVENGTLVVRTKDQEARFDLGPGTAERWLRTIQEPKGLLEKLELDAQSRVATVDIHDPPFLSALRDRTALIGEGRVPVGAPVIFFGADTREALRKIPLLRTRMPDAGVLWVVRPKGVKSISESDVFAALKEAGLVDTKVVSFSKTHTAHKAVIPVELRGKAVPRRPIVSLPPQAPPAKARSTRPAAPAPETPAKKVKRPKPGRSASQARGRGPR